MAQDLWLFLIKVTNILAKTRVESVLFPTPWFWVTHLTFGVIGGMAVILAMRRTHHGSWENVEELPGWHST